MLAVTAHAGQADERRVLSAGFNGYLCKPVDVQALAREILRVTQAPVRSLTAPSATPASASFPLDK